jgi:hypothetical protein
VLALAQLSGCADETLGFRLELAVAPAVPAASETPADLPAGLCPTARPDRLPVGNDPGQVTLLRLTVLAHEDPPRFLCDRLLSLGSGNVAEILVPDRAPLYDVQVEAYGAPATPTGVPPLLYAGMQPEVPAAGGVAQVLLLRPVDFGCLPTQMAQPRAFHSATVLPDGSVLLAGGLTEVVNVDRQQLSATASIEIYRPRTRSFESPADLRVAVVPRAFHQAVLLDGGPPYALLLLGGITPPDGADAGSAVAALRLGTELLRVGPIAGTTAPAPPELLIYDPQASTVQTASIQVDHWRPRMLAAATEDSTPLPLALLGGGAQALTQQGFTPEPSLVSGSLVDGVPSAELPALAAPRIGATVTPLDDSRALVFGGDLGVAGMEVAQAAELVSGVGGALATRELPLAMGSTAPVPTAFHTATRLPDGTVAIVGGYVVSATAATEPNAAAPVQRVGLGGMDALTVQAMQPLGFIPVGHHATLLLPELHALLVSGGNPAMGPGGCGTLCSTRNAYLLDSGTLTLRAASRLEVARFGHRQVPLGDGTVLVTGGLRWDPDNHDHSVLVLDRAELFNPHDASYDPANLPPISAGRAPAAEADHQNVAFPRCPTPAELKMMNP